jgi:hypothetical protein
MRNLTWNALVALAVAGGPAVAAAQHNGMSHGGSPGHEFGADLAFVYEHEASLLSGGAALNHVLIATPVDLRLGFQAGQKLTVEPRIVFALDSKGALGKSAYMFAPDLNLLFSLGPDTKRGAYVTVGGGVDLQHAAGTSASQFSFNGGLGTRVPYESGAIRLEAFARYALKKVSDGLPNTLDLGVRIGLSLWH